MGYKPKVGDLVELKYNVRGMQNPIGIIECVNKTRSHNNGTINVRILQLADVIIHDLHVSKIKLVSSLDKKNNEWYTDKT
jgi:hypothetical protein